MIDLRFALGSLNLLTEVLCLKSNVSVNLWSDFIALGFLVDTYGLGVIGMLLVHTLGVETIAAKCLCTSVDTHI